MDGGWQGRGGRGSHLSFKVHPCVKFPPIIPVLKIVREQDVQRNTKQHSGAVVFQRARAASRRYSGHREITLLYASIKNSEFSIFISIIIILKVFRHIMRGALTEKRWAGWPHAAPTRLLYEVPEAGRHFEKPNKHIPLQWQDLVNFYLHTAKRFLCKSQWPVISVNY